MSAPKTKPCSLCGRLSARGRFTTVCDFCVKENDNQTLEAALGMPGNVLDDAEHHEVDCAHWAGFDCDCQDGDALDPAAMSFHEAIND